MPSMIAWIENDTDVINPVIKQVEKTHHIKKFNTVGEALENIDAIKASQLIILDIILPLGSADMYLEQPTGLGLLKILRGTHGIKQPVVILSVFPPEKIKDFIGIVDLDIAEHLSKPVRPSKLKATVDRILKIPA